jgi:hypothetical protein
MTPTIQAVLNDSTQPIRMRKFVDDGNVLADLTSAHCFECSDVMGLAQDMAKRFVRTGSSEILGFLPSPVTVLDFKNPRWPIRTAIVLTEEDGGVSSSSVNVTRHELFSMKRRHIRNVLPPRHHYHPTAIARGENLASLDEGEELILALLAIINSPRVIGQRQHMPHAGLQRKIAASRGMVGRYPLHAWHEVVLEVAPPRIDDREPYETHLTGERALHFCRKHIRLRLGQLEWVSWHWRGNAALGIKQTRYRIDRGA